MPTRYRFGVSLAAGLAALVMSAASHAAIIEFNIVLEPEQEVSAPTLGGATPSGAATILANTDTLFVEITGTYTGMTSDVNNSHLHGLAPAGINAGVLFSLTNDGGTSGALSGSGVLSGANFQGLLDGNTYINVHTINNLGGEIRGQVVPTPGSIAIGSLAMVMFFWRRRP